MLEQIVHCGDLIVLVPIQTLSCIVFLKTIAFEVSEEGRLNGNLILTNDQALALTHWLVSLIPRVLFDLVRSEPLVWVCLENLVDQVDTLGAESFRHLKLAGKNFLIQLSR